MSLQLNCCLIQNDLMFVNEKAIHISYLNYRYYSICI